MPKLALMVIGFVVFLVLVIGAGGAWIVRQLGDEVGSVVTMQEQDDRTIPVPGVKRLRVRVDRADVRIFAGSGTAAQVTAVRMGAAKTQAEAVDRAKAIVWSAEVKGDALEVAAKLPEGPGVEELGTMIQGGAHRLALAIYVPAGTAVDAEVGTGDLSVQQARAPVAAKVGTGEVRVREAHGDVAAEAGTGAVEVTGGRGATYATAGTGDVAVGHRPGPRLEMKTGTGDLDWAFPYEAPAVNRLEAGTGTITLSVGTNANVALELEAATGQVTNLTKLPGAIRPNEAGTGARASLKAGTGQAKLGARTGTGDVLVEGPRGPDAPRAGTPAAGGAAPP